MATLPISGPISISQINAEFNRGNNLGAYRGTTWFRDNGTTGTFSSGAISMSEFYGKRKTAPVTISLAGIQNNTFDYDIVYDGGTVPIQVLGFGSTGLIGDITGYVSNWATPTTAGIGSSYWLRATRTATAGSGTSTPTTGWLSLSTQVNVTAQKSNGNPGAYSATYTIEISTNSSGTNIVAVASAVRLFVAVTSA